MRLSLINRRRRLFCLLLLIPVFSGVFFVSFQKTASAANPTTMNFQGKVVNSDGTNVSNGTYSFIFRIYNTSSPTMTTSCTSTASCLWQETQGSITVTNGVFQVELGSSCALTSSSCNNSTGGPINWGTTSSLYLTLQFNGDTSGANGGYMSPTMHLTSVPFAFNADQLGGIAASGFVQLQGSTPGTPQTGNLNISGTGIFSTAVQTPTVQGSTTLSLLSTTTSAISLDSGTTGAINIGTGANGKAITIGGTTAGTTVAITAGTTANAAVSISTSGAGGITIDSGTTGNINIGNNANSKAVAIGNSQTGTTVTSTAGGVVNILTNSGATVRTNTNSLTAFQVQNSSSVTSFNINTLASGLNLLANSSFEQNINGWSARATPTGGTPLWDNSSGNANFGTASLRLATDAALDGALFNFPFKASTQYSMSLYAKVASGSQAFILGRQDVASDSDCAGTITVTTTYQQFTCTFTTGSTIGGASNFYIEQSGTGTPTIYIDGVTLVESASAQAYANPAENIQIDANYSNITLNANQSPELQPWRLNPNALTTARRGATTVTANGYTYFIGGTTSNGSSGAAVTTINFAKLNADGSLGAWSTSGITALPVALYGHSSFVVNGYLYVIGGCTAESSFAANCSTAVSTVYYSKLNGDGTNGTWQTNTYSLPAVRGYGTAVYSGGFVYFLGGTSGAASQTTAYSAKVNADGSISSWTTSGVTALSAARYGHTAVAANGNIYIIGGCNDTTDTAADCDAAEGLTTVQWATPTSAGGLGSWTTASSLNTATGLHTAAILNGYIYVIGGRQAGAPVNAVVYSKITSTGTLGVWANAANTLPAGSPRQGASGTWANNYVYVFGGFDGTTTLPTSTLYSSGARILVYGGLDLVGLTGQGLGDYSGGGTLTAGNTRVVGDLRVEGWADFNNGLTVDSALNINGVSATNGQTILNVNNSSSNSIFSVRHMAANFGSLVTGGAFMQKNSYFGEEFNISPVNASQTCLANATETNVGWSRGDMGSHNNAAVTCGTSLDQFSGEFNWSTKNGAATASQGCTVAYQNTVNGVERITATSTATASNSASCTEALAATRTTSNKIYLVNNLPVATYKIKMNNLTASQNADRIRIGLSNVNTATALGAPTDGIFFSNCSTESTTTGSVSGCSNTTWYGHSFNGSAQVSGGPVTCSIGSGSLTAQFSYLRIEVRATNDIHFYADYNTADGINESECGTGIAGGSSTSAALTTWTHATVATNAARNVSVDLDYIRIWQDDNVPLPAQAIINMPTTDEEIITKSPLSIEATDHEDPGILFSFSAATSEDFVVEKDLYVKGTVFANKVKANQIEGLEIFTDKISSLQERLTNALSPTASAEEASSASPLTTPAPMNLSVDNGLSVGGRAEFKGNAFFYKLVTFAEKTIFNNDITLAAHLITNGDAPTFTLEGAAGTIETSEDNPEASVAGAKISGNDISGNLNIQIGEETKEGNLISIQFKKPYDKPPRVFLSANNKSASELKYYVNSNKSDFKIIVTNPPTPGTVLEFGYWVVE